MRTTIDLHDPVLKDLKRLQQREGKSLGQLASELLAKALAEAKHREAPRAAFAWHSQPMGARVNLADRDALLDAMDEPPRRRR